MVFVLTGATLAYTGCTDFSEDIKAVNDRVDQISGSVDKLVSGDVATIQTQIANMQSTIAALETAKADASSAIENLKGRTSTLEGQVGTLQAKASDLEKNLATLTSDLNAVNKALDNLKSDTNKQIDDVKASVAELKSQLASEKVALEAKIATVENELSKVKADLAAVQTVAATNKENITVLQGKVENIEKTIITMNASIDDLKANKADKTWVETTFATLEQIDAANKAIIALKSELVAVNARIDAAESRISAAEARLNNIDAYHKQMEETISDIYGNIDAFKKAIAAIEARLDGHDGILAAYNNTLTALANGLAAAQKDIKANTALINEALKDIESLSKELAETNDAIDALALELADVQSLANSALDLAKDNQGEISAIKKALNNIYTKEEVDAKTAALRDMIITLTEANRKALEAYKKEANGRLDAVEASIADLAKKHSDLTADFKQFVNVTFEDFKDETAESIADLQDQIDDLSALLDEKVADLEELIADTKEEIETLIANVKADLITKIATAQAEAVATATANAKSYTDVQIAELYEKVTDEYGTAIALAVLNAYTNAVNYTNAELDAMYEKITEDYSAEVAAKMQKAYNDAVYYTNCELNAMYEAITEEYGDAIGAALLKAFNDAANYTNAEINVMYEKISEEQKAAVAAAIVDAVAQAKGYTDAAIATLTKAYEAADADLKASIEAVDKKVDALSGSFDTYKAEMAETLSKVGDRITNVESDVEALASRIQSIAYVPEYAKGAYAQKVKIGTDVIGTFTTATFKVFPAECALLFSTAKLDDECPIKVFATKTLKAAECTEVDIKNIVVDYADPDNGLVTIVIKEELKGKAIALAYQASTKWEDNTTGTYVTSDFATVQDAADTDILGAYVYYDAAKKHKFVAGDGDVTVAWDECGEEYLPYGSYEIYLELEAGKYTTIADAEEMFYLPAGSLVPTNYKNIVTYSTTPDPKGMECLSVKDGKGANEISIKGTKGDAMVNYVDAWAEVTPTYKVAGHSVTTLAIPSTYTVGWKERKYVLDTKAQAAEQWSYDFAVAHSSAQAADKYLNRKYQAVDELGQAIEFAFENNEVVKDELTPALYADILTMPVSLNVEKKAADATNFTTVAAPAGSEMIMTYKSSVLGPVMTIALRPYNKQGLYAFGENGKEVTWKYTNVYSRSADKTRYSFEYNVTFGAAPQDATYDTGLIEIPFLTGGVVTHNFGDKLMQKLYSERIDAATKAGFATYADFKATVFAQTLAATTPKYTEPATPTNKTKDADPAMTYLTVDAIAQLITLSTADIYAAPSLDIKKTTTSFENSYKTWWGPTYTFKSSAKVVVPAYKLVPDYYMVEAGNRIEVQGQKVAGVWTMQDINLPKYFGIEGPTGETSLKVKFVPKTTPSTGTPETGIYNVPQTYDPATPAIVTYNFNVIANTDAYLLAPSNLKWGVIGGSDFTGREVEYEVQLLLDDTGAGCQFPMDGTTVTFYTKKMIDEISYTSIERSRVAYEEVAANLWEGLNVYGLDANDTEVDGYVHPGAPERGTNFAFYNGTVGKFITKAANKYQLVADFKIKDGAKMLCKVYDVDNPGTPYSQTWVEERFDLNDADGIITLKKDAAKVLKDLRFEVDVVVNYVSDYAGVDAETTKAYVTFKKQE